MSHESFIAVGENIHCTRILKAGGELVSQESILYKEGGVEKRLRIPRPFLESSDWANGKVRHAAVAIWQGMFGEAADREPGRNYLRHLAQNQEASGASFLDVNVDEFSTDLTQKQQVIRWTAELVQGASTLPLSIDSSNLDILKAGLEACKGRRPMVNSVSLERPDAIATAVHARAAVIAGAGGENGMPNGGPERIQNLIRLVDILRGNGLTDGDIYLDPLVFPVAVDPHNGLMILETIKELRTHFGPGIHFAPGLSNISYGMPNRKLINRVFAWLCAERGLDGGIVDPAQINRQVLARLDPRSEGFRITRAFLEGEDSFGAQYIAAIRAHKI